MSESFNPELTPEQIEKLNLSPNQVHTFESFAGATTQHFFDDFILDHISIERLRSLDIDSHLLALALRKEIVKGKEVQVSGMNIELFLEVGDDTWEITL